MLSCERWKWWGVAVMLGFFLGSTIGALFQMLQVPLLWAFVADAICGIPLGIALYRRSQERADW